MPKEEEGPKTGTIAMVKNSSNKEVDGILIAHEEDLPTTENSLTMISFNANFQEQITSLQNFRCSIY